MLANFWNKCRIKHRKFKHSEEYRSFSHYKPHKIVQRYIHKKTWRKKALLALKAVHKCQQDGLTIWLAYGTLLGAVREKDFIAHDDDLDFGAYLDDRNEAFDNIFQVNGFKKKREMLLFFEDGSPYGAEECYQHMESGVTVDVFFFRKEENNILCHSFSCPWDLKWPKACESGQVVIREQKWPDTGLDNCDFLGLSMLVPKDPHNHLLLKYGPNYMTPVTEWEDTMTNNKREFTGMKVIYKRYF